MSEGKRVSPSSQTLLFFLSPSTPTQSRLPLGMYCRLYQQCSGHLRLCDFFWAPSSQDESFPAYTTEQYDVFPLRTTWTFIYSALWWILCCDNNPRRSFSLSFGTAQTVFIPNKLLIQSHYSLGRLMFYLVCVCVCVIWANRWFRRDLL